jgi:hypothetical protein
VVRRRHASMMLIPDGSPDWFTGEANMAVCWCLAHITLGAFAVNVIRTSYSALNAIRKQALEHQLASPPRVEWISLDTKAVS